MSRHPHVSPRAIESIIDDLDARDLLWALRNVAKRHHVSEQEIVSRKRSKPFVKARHEWWAYLRFELGWSSPIIAKVHGVDHSTVLLATMGVLKATADAPTSEVRSRVVPEAS